MKCVNCFPISSFLIYLSSWYFVLGFQVQCIRLRIRFRITLIFQCIPPQIGIDRKIHRTFYCNFFTHLFSKTIYGPPETISSFHLWRSPLSCPHNSIFMYADGSDFIICPILSIRSLSYICKRTSLIQPHYCVLRRIEYN